MSRARFKEIASKEDLDRIVDGSFSKPAIILKHSTTCPVSLDAYERVSEIDCDLSLVVVQEAREVSDAIEEITSVRHESPQALVISRGECVYHASHFGIQAEELEKYKDA